MPSNAQGGERWGKNGTAPLLRVWENTADHKNCTHATKHPAPVSFAFPGAETGESEKMQHGCSCDQSSLLFIYSAQLLQSSAYRAYLETPAAQRKDATKQMVEEGVVY